MNLLKKIKNKLKKNKDKEFVDGSLVKKDEDGVEAKLKDSKESKASIKDHISFGA